MPPFLRIAASTLPALVLLAAAGDARAQVHADVGAQVGAMKRFLTNRNPDGSDAGFGPVGKIDAHLALLPMLRGGLYLTHDISPISGEPARQITTGGVELRLVPPVLRSEKYASYFALGFGYAGVYAPSFHSSQPNPQVPNGSTDVAFSGDKGHFFEVPIAFGMTWKLARPWSLLAELGGRIGFGAGGPVYDGRSGTATGIPQVSPVPDGNDTFALGLSIGIQLDL